jgi:Glycosyl hydrolases family 38 N-terminal domain/Glycosyl hydrolases family 38 C-terminal domain
MFVPETRSAVDATLVLEASGETLRRPLRIEPQRKWSVSVVHHSHLDIGYTDLQGDVLRHHLAYLDHALELAAQTDGWPDDAQFRWNVESLLPLERWLATRPAGAVDELSARVRSGRFEVCALPFGTNVEALSVDELARLLRPADELRETRGFPIVTAMQTDVPGAPLGLPAALAGAGVKYLSVAHNYASRAAPYLTGGEKLPRLFYWASPAGERVLVWQTDSPHGVAYLEGNLLGLADSPELAEELLPEYLAALAGGAYPYGTECAALGLPRELDTARAPYPHDVLHVRVQGLLADNAPPSIVPAEVVRAWNERWSFPRLRLACNAEFFAEAESRLGPRLETFSGDWTSWWADGLGSGARVNGLNRRAQALVRTGQTLNVLADRLGEQDAWADDADRAYEALGMFDEHTWGAAHPDEDAIDGRRSGVLQWQTKAAFAASAYDRSSSLVERGTARLAAHVPKASLLVVNTASFPRTDVVRVLVPSEGVGVRDTRFAIEPGPTGRNRPQGVVLSFLARDVPALGFRRYKLVPAAFAHGTPGPASTLENEHYRVELDLESGCVTSLFDRELGLELVDGASPFGFGQYVYDRYAGWLSATLRPGGEPAPGAALEGEARVESRTPARNGLVVERVSTPVEERVTLRLDAAGARGLEVTYRLVRGVRRLDVEYQLDKTATMAKESVYLVFPFAVDASDVQYEVTGGVDRPGARLPGSAAHMQVVRHWAALEGGGVSVSLATFEATLLETGSIHLPYPPYGPTAEARSGTLVAWAMNNVWDTHFPRSQAGETRFAFCVSSRAGDARQLGMRSAAALTRPLLGIVGAGRASGLGEGSFCTIDHPQVEVVNLGASRRGHDLVAFVHSLAEEEVDVRVDFPAVVVERVWLGTFLERDEREVTGERVRLRPGDYVSLAVDLRKR